MGHWNLCQIVEVAVAHGSKSLPTPVVDTSPDKDWKQMSETKSDAGRRWFLEKGGILSREGSSPTGGYGAEHADTNVFTVIVCVLSAMLQI